MEFNPDVTGLLISTATLFTVLLLTLSPPLAQCQVVIDPTVRVNVTFDNGLDADLVTLLVDMHNVYRREEFADNMNRLEWSEFLSYHATQWVKICEFKHQTDPPWGENMYRSVFKTSLDNTINNGLLAWHLEKYNIMPSAGGVDCCSPTKQTCCLYTQLVWGSTEYVGCAITQCPLLRGENKKFDYQNAWFLACYYYPPGNVLTQQPFETGKGVCTNCSATKPDCDRGLCYFDETRCGSG